MTEKQSVNTQAYSGILQSIPFTGITEYLWIMDSINLTLWLILVRLLYKENPAKLVEIVDAIRVEATHLRLLSPVDASNLESIADILCNNGSDSAPVGQENVSKILELIKGGKKE